MLVDVFLENLLYQYTKLTSTQVLNSSHFTIKVLYSPHDQPTKLNVNSDSKGCEHSSHFTINPLSVT